MNLETSLNYVTLHSQSIIQWVFLVIVLLVGILIAHALFGRRETEVVAGAGVLASPEMAAALARVLEQNANHAVAPAAHGSGDAVAPAASADVAPGAGVPAELEGKLKNMEFELRARDQELAKLRAGDGQTVVAGTGAMADRLHELETKLAEYEILEDDIADLSLYKEENTRLRAELELLRGEGEGDGADAPSPVAQPTAAPAARTGEPDAAAEPARTAVAAAAAAASLAAFDEPAPPPAEPATAAASVEAAPAPDEPIRHDLAAGADDLFAEFATALEESGVDLSSDAPKGETGT